MNIQAMLIITFALWIRLFALVSSNVINDMDLMKKKGRETLCINTDVRCWFDLSRFGSTVDVIHTSGNRKLKKKTFHLFFGVWWPVNFGVNDIRQYRQVQSTAEFKVSSIFCASDFPLGKRNSVKNIRRKQIDYSILHSTKIKFQSFKKLLPKKLMTFISFFEK